MVPKRFRNLNRCTQGIEPVRNRKKQNRLESNRIESTGAPRNLDAERIKNRIKYESVVCLNRIASCGPKSMQPIGDGYKARMRGSLYGLCL